MCLFMIHHEQNTLNNNAMVKVSGTVYLRERINDLLSRDPNITHLTVPSPAHRCTVHTH